jgi:ClpP class serine protease
MQSDEIKKIESKLNMVIDSKMALEINAVDHYTNDIVIDSAGVGSIIVSGVLMPEPSPLLDFMNVNYTAYSDINKQIESLEADDSVKSLMLKMNSPGGAVIGMYKTMDVIANSTKPITVQATGQLASGAYILATQADTITAVDELTEVGSNGVVKDSFVSDNVVSVTNTASPKKRNDVKTEEGLKNEKAMLDDFYGVIVEKVAKGRGTTVEAVNANYGQGSIMTARTALKNGMIDAIGIIKPAEQTAITEETRAMDKALLKAEHPELYSAILAEGNEAGKVEVNTLTQAHLVLADASGDMERALSDIKAGVLVDAAVMAHHTAQGIKKSQIVAHQDEAPVVPETSDEVEVDADKELEKEMNAIEGLEVTL